MALAACLRPQPVCSFAVEFSALLRNGTELRKESAIRAGDVREIAQDVYAGKSLDGEVAAALRFVRRVRAAILHWLPMARPLARRPRPPCVFGSTLPSESSTWSGATSFTSTPSRSCTPFCWRISGGILVGLREKTHAEVSVRGLPGRRAPPSPPGRGTRLVMQALIISASDPAISVPVGPPPMITKFRAPFSSSVGSRSASSKTARTRERSRCASFTE